MSGRASGDKAGGGFASVFSVVPTVYYDLIARLAPGLAVWFALWASTTSAMEFNTVRTFLEANLFLVLILSYVTGMVLTGVSALWDALAYAVFWFIKPFKVPLGLDGVKSFIAVWESVAKAMDETAKVSESAGAIATKALAEVALTQNLLTGTCALGLLGLSTGGRLFPSPVAHCWPFGVAAAVLLLAMLFRQAMFLGRVKVLHATYCGDAASVPQAKVPAGAAGSDSTSE